MTTLCTEKLEVWIEYYPFHKSLNKKLIEESLQLPFVTADKAIQQGGNLSNVKALQTCSDNPVVESPSFQVIYEWIYKIIKNKTPGWNYKIVSSWVAKYNKGEYTLNHKHDPVSYSFVYFIKCPKGSSPLIFTRGGKRIKAEEGKAVIFPGNLYHYVPKNRCDDRIVLAGNIISRWVDASGTIVE